MSTNKEVVEALGETWSRVTPTHHVDTGDRAREQEYTFSRVYVDDIEGDSLSVPHGATFELPEDGLFTYQYRDKPKVLVTQNGPHVKDDASSKEGENQAYFALSILSELGVVGSWSKA